MSYIKHRLVLTVWETELALKLWGLGCDTFDIAKKLNVHEAAIYNTLSVERGKRRAA